MIATRRCSTQLNRLVAKRFFNGNAGRPQFILPSSLTSVSPTSVSSHFDDKKFYSNTTSHTYQPMGDLFQYTKEQGSVVIGQDFVGKTASISRVFGPGANAQALLTCGGEELAQNASFDPNYETSKDWIRTRPVGPAVLSSTLISGLIGALIEASFPQTVPVNSSMSFLRPLIVGMEVEASIKVEAVNETKRTEKTTTGGQNGTAATGYEILLSTQVIRVQDNAVIAEGLSTVWIPGYL